MDSLQLLTKIIWSLLTIWKDSFGLYTQYIGYLPIEAEKSILLIKRSLDDDSKGTEGFDLDHTNKYAVEHGIRPLPPLEEMDVVLPRIWSHLKQFDLSETSIPEKQWDEMVEYLDLQAAKERK